MIVQGKEKIDGCDADFNWEMFDYLSEIIESNKKRKMKDSPFLQDSLNDKETPKSKSWHGCNSYKEAENLAINGWKEAEENEILNDIFNLKIDDEDKLISFKNDVVGFTPVVPLVLQGIPKCMTNVSKKRVKSKIIHLVYNISITCGTQSEEIMNAGIELFKVIMKLERQGYRVRLTAMQEFSNRESGDCMLLNLKSEYKPLHITSMMFPLIHTSMFRVIGFGWFERSPVTNPKSGYGHQFTTEFGKPRLIKLLKKVLKTENLIYLEFKEIDGKKADEIIKFISKIIK